RLGSDPWRQILSPHLDRSIPPSTRRTTTVTMFSRPRNSVSSMPSTVSSEVRLRLLHCEPVNIIRVAAILRVAHHGSVAVRLWQVNGETRIKIDRLASRICGRLILPGNALSGFIVNCHHGIEHEPELHRVHLQENGLR